MATRPEVVSRRVVVATHGHCFDGAACAAVFTRLVATLEASPLTFSYRACTYGPGPNIVGESILDGEVNALLDFRYTTAPQLGWYFDHHKTAFASPEDLAHFAADPSGRRFHDASYGSCTRLVADVARDRFGFRDPGLDELVRWAEVIDTASFDSAEHALRRDLPALRVMSVVEQRGDAAFLSRLVPALATRTLDDIANDAMISKPWRLLERKLAKLVDRIRLRSTVAGRVVMTDLTDALTEIVGKYIPYALFPDIPYSIVVSRSRTRIKLSVGFNPWSPVPRRHDIATLCARFGGGGHPVVGAIAFPADQLELAQEVARLLARELDSDPDQAG